MMKKETVYMEYVSPVAEAVEIQVEGNILNASGVTGGGVGVNDWDDEEILVGNAQ